MAVSSSAPRVAVVLPGGGARGAYEAGALSVLLPALEERGERVTIITGTSVGAINAALLGSLADRSADEITSALLERWRTMRKADVLRPVVGPGLPLLALRAVGAVLGVPGARFESFLDPSPLERSLDRWVDWVSLHRNVRSGAVQAVCVVTTSLARGGPVAFTHTSGPLPRDTEVHYVPVVLSGEHVRASAAIPLLFPPVAVTTPKASAGYYIDGGTRLNSPISPAIALGAERVIVLGFEPFLRKPHVEVDPGASPRIGDVAANILDGLLVDQVADDVHRTAAINSFFVDGPTSGPSTAARAYRVARGHAPYRRISYALVAPERHGELAEVAEETFEDRYGGLRGLLDPDYPLISRLLGGAGARVRGELLSFLLFDPDYVERLIDLGRRDAHRWIARHPRMWCSDAAHDLEMDTARSAQSREQQALDEFRSMRRR